MGTTSSANRQTEALSSINSQTEATSSANSQMETTAGEEFPPMDPEAAPFVLFVPTYENAEFSDKEAFYSISQDKAFMERMDEMDLDKYVYWVTPDGWLLVLDPETYNAFLWTPLTKQRIELPAMEDIKQRIDPLPGLEEYPPGPYQSVCLLSHKPTDPDCIVLLVHLEDTVFWFCRPGESQWVKHDYRDEVLQIRRIAAVNGVFYIDLLHAIVTLRFCPSPAFTTEAVEHRDWLDHHHDDMCQLVESCGELFRVGVELACVYKMDFLEKTWVRVTEFGDRAFFLDRYTWGASCSASQFGLDRGGIYFLTGKEGIILISHPNNGFRQLVYSRGGLDASRTMHSFLMPLAS